MNTTGVCSPFFSIIIPTYNRPFQLKQCLESITKLTYPKANFEVVIVDDGSPGDMRGIVEMFNDSLHIKLLKQKNAGPASARNTATTIANGTYLAFTDDDCCPAPDWLNKFAVHLDKTPNKLLGGRTINLLKNNKYSSASQFIVDIVYKHYNSNPNEARFFASNNMVIPAQIFNEIGKFANGWRTSEDREICDRWLMNGYKMKYVEEAIIYHSHKLTFWSFCKQHFSYGKGAYHYHKIRKHRGSGAMIQEVNFHINLKNWLFAAFSRKEENSVGLFLCLLLWQIANLYGFIWAACFEKPKYLNS